MWLFGCQDVPSFGGFLSRCSIFRQGESFCVCSSVNVCVCGSLAVKMFHLSAASCQDAPSLGRESHFCVYSCVNVCPHGSVEILFMQCCTQYDSECTCTLL